MSVNSFSGMAAVPTSYGFTAGKNKIINGDFGVWQRGTSFSITANSTYTSDRFLVAYSTAAPTSWTISQQTFTPGTAPVAGYEGQYFFRSQMTTIGTATFPSMRQRIEDVRTFAGRSVTVSFWAKADTTRTVTSALTQVFGTGGSTAVTALDGGSLSLTTSWTRFSYTGSIPSISGKTIGTNGYLQFAITLPAENATIDIWGVQIEYGSTATPFQTATGTIQGELAACQRYYQRFNASSVYTFFCNGNAYSTTQATTILPLPVTLRTAPSSIETTGTASNYRLTNGASATACNSVPALDQAATQSLAINFYVASGLTAGQAINAGANNTASAYIGVSAEL